MIIPAASITRKGGDEMIARTQRLVDAKEAEAARGQAWNGAGKAVDVIQRGVPLRGLQAPVFERASQSCIFISNLPLVVAALQGVQSTPPRRPARSRAE